MYDFLLIIFIGFKLYLFFNNFAILYLSAPCCPPIAITNESQIEANLEISFHY